MKSRMEQVLSMNVMEFFFHWELCGSEKAYAIKDLIIRLQKRRNHVRYINARDFDSYVLGVLESFLKTELGQVGLPLDKAAGDLTHVVLSIPDSAVS